MGTLSNFLQTALDDVGYTEHPAGSNNTKYGEWIGLQGQPWCMSAIQYWATKANVALPLRTGSCMQLMQAAKKSGQWVTQDYEVGDIVIFQWSNGQRHCGIIVEQPTNYIPTIEGNTAVGNNSNGGAVMLRKRTYQYVLGAVRPEFEPDAYKQFTDFLSRYRATLRDNDASDYSNEAREWAIEAEIIKGNGTILEGQPNYMWADFLTREQFVTMLYRYDQYRNKQEVT